MAEPDHTGAAATKVGHGLNKKVGPLPLWAWGALLGVVAYFVYARESASSASSASSLTNADAGTANTLDSSSIDPNTGLTYLEEEQDAENANAQDNSGALSGGGTTDSGMTTESPDDTISDALNIFSTLQSAEQTAQAAYMAANPYTTAATADPTTTAGGPTVTPTTSGTSPTVTASTQQTPAQAAAVKQTAAVAAASKILATGNDGAGGTLKGAESLNKVTTPKIPVVKTTKPKTVTKTKK